MTRNRITRTRGRLPAILAILILIVVCLNAHARAENSPDEKLPPIRAITEGPEFHWFSYYDKFQFDPTGRYVLGMEVDFEHRSPRPDNVIKIGMIDLQDNDRWIELGESRAWGWQQGCMLQWRPGSKSEILWNDRQGDRFVCHILDVFTGEKRTIPHAVYTVSPDGRTAVAPDFRRIQDMRPGYGYAGLPDPYKDDLAPQDSGILRVDLHTGEAELIVSLADMLKIPYEHGEPDEFARSKHWFNHLLFNPDGTRFIFLHRWRMKEGSQYRKVGGFGTRMLTASPDGKDLRVVDGYGKTSHFIWRDPKHILAWAWHPSHQSAFYLYEDGSDKVQVVGKGIMTRNGHCTYLPGNEWILNDAYPDKQRNQHVYLYHVPTGKTVPLGSFNLAPEYKGEWRCDTHPRFSRDGTKVMIDSPHGGNGRQMYLIDISGIVGRTTADASSPFDMHTVLEISLESPLRQLRAVPVNLGKGRPRAILAVYSADAEVDPWVEMFFFPKSTLKLALFTEKSEILWKRDLGPGVIPGIWFCPVYPFDLDGDGVDEIWFVNNTDPDHPLSLRSRRLERIDSRTGKTSGQWPWAPPFGGQSLSHTFRNFILGGCVRGQPVLVTAQGTYGPMRLQGWNPDMSPRWEHVIQQGTPGARGSHMCPVVDINDDGVDEILWGERCIELDTGKELFCADRDLYRGHSDVVQPVLDTDQSRWSIYTCRESGGVSPRVVLFDDKGKRVWGDIEEGHMDMGWAARIGDNGEHIVMAIRIGAKSAGPKGFFRKGVEEFTYEALTGKEHLLPFSVFSTIPVDLNGDGVHELVRGLAEGDGSVLDRNGRLIASLSGSVAAASKLLDCPGEQVLCYDQDGTVRVWADRNAKDSEAARARYANPFYQANQRLTATGYNLVNLGGL